jgi:hypothetical protein
MTTWDAYRRLAQQLGSTHYRIEEDGSVTIGVDPGVYPSSDWERARSYERPRVTYKGNITTREMAELGIAALSNDEPCIGCGQAWAPTSVPNQRVLDHLDACPYTEALAVTGI